MGKLLFPVPFPQRELGSLQRGGRGLDTPPAGRGAPNPALPASGNCGRGEVAGRRGERGSWRGIAVEVRMGSGTDGRHGAVRMSLDWEML